MGPLAFGISSAIIVIMYPVCSSVVTNFWIDIREGGVPEHSGAHDLQVLQWEHPHYLRRPCVYLLPPSGYCKYNIFWPPFWVTNSVCESQLATPLLIVVISLRLLSSWRREPSTGVPGAPFVLLLLLEAPKTCHPRLGVQGAEV